MIARKITYLGKFTDELAGEVFDITRKNEITGVIKKVNEREIELSLEGDPSQIKLIQHQIEKLSHTFLIKKSFKFLISIL
jgi:acylphosphatase